MHADILVILGCSIKQLAHGTQRMANAKQVISAFCSIIQQLELCSQQLPDEYNQYCTSKFTKQTEQLQNPTQPVKPNPLAFGGLFGSIKPNS